MLLVKLGGGKYNRDFLVGHKGQNIYNVHTLRGTASLGNFICLYAVHSAEV